MCLSISGRRLHTYHRLRGKVVLKGRRPVEATDDYDTDSDEADDDLTELQSIWTEKTNVTVSTYQIGIIFAFVIVVA